MAVLYGMTPDGRPGRPASASWSRPACGWRSCSWPSPSCSTPGGGAGGWASRCVEPQLVQIGGSELVGAVGNLHAADPRPRSGGPAAARRPAPPAGRAPRPAARTRTPDVIAEVTAARSGVDRDQVARAVTDIPVRTEDELLDLARDIDRIRTEVLHGTAP